jgi:hypothetical protein
MGLVFLVQCRGQQDALGVDLMSTLMEHSANAGQGSMERHRLVPNAIQPVQPVTAVEQPPVRRVALTHS